MRRIALVLSLIVAAIPVESFAQGSSTNEVRIAPADCRRLVQHRPAPDVAYQPGVDVRGNAVAPADLPGQARISAPNEITIGLTVDLLRQYGVPASSPLAPRGEASVGTVTYDIASGRMTFNGQPLSDPEQDALAAACAAMKGKQ